MAGRIANPYWFRAEAARLPWAQIALAQRHARVRRARRDRPRSRQAAQADA